MALNPGTCIHYNGLLNDTCEAGHRYLGFAIALTQSQMNWHNENYPELDVARTALSDRIPCFAKNDIHTCLDFREPTQAELDQNKAEITVMIARVGKSRAAIVAYCEENKRSRGTKGEIPCPICQVGILQFSRSAYNGHIHARCNTMKCVNFME